MASKSTEASAAVEEYKQIYIFVLFSKKNIICHLWLREEAG